MSLPSAYIRKCRCLHASCFGCDLDKRIGFRDQVDPISDTDVINFELALADISQIEKRLERLRKGRAKTKEEEAAQQARETALGPPWPAAISENNEEHE